MSHLVKDELEKLRAPTARADSGGIRSHPAIIAREYLVPAVVAMGKETGFLRVGQVVTVDGPLGRIEIAPEE